jgi:serine/threonine-protein kinase
VSDFPGGADIRKLFRLADSDPIFAARVRTTDAPRGSWYLLVRLAPDLEERFGIRREFVVYCTPVDDLQVRAMDQLRKIIRSVLHDIDPDHAIIVTSDPLATEKLKDWSVDRRLLLAPLVPDDLPRRFSSGDPRDALPRLLEEWWFGRNLYEERTPVTGSDFFGRSKEVQHLVLAAEEGRHVGAFGLRKIGKTSLLFEVQRHLRSRGDVVPAFIDLQGSAAADAAGHVAYRIASVLEKEFDRSGRLSKQAFRETVGLPRRYAQLSSRDWITSLADGLRALLDADEALRLAVILDEAEILLPGADDPLTDARELFQALRSVAQESGRLSLIVAGVNATPCERPTLGGVDNPLFGLLTVQYIGPLDREACREMIVRVGAKMGLRWPLVVAMQIVEAVGGHPLLARLACSDVAETHPERPWDVPLSTVTKVLSQFHLGHPAELNEMLESLRRYYATEFELLSLISKGLGERPEELDEWRRIYPDAINHLVGYGVLDALRMRIEIAPLQVMLT